MVSDLLGDERHQSFERRSEAEGADWNERRETFMRRVYRALLGQHNKPTEDWQNFSEAKFEAAVDFFVRTIFTLISKKEPAVLKLIEPEAELLVYLNSFS